MKENELNPEIKNYFSLITKKVNAQFEIASNARKKGFDPETEIECQPTNDIADRTEKIIGPKGIAERFRTLSLKEKDRTKIIFQIFRELIEQTWYHEPNAEKRLEQAVKTCLMLVTEGVVVAPLDGVPKVKISENFDKTKFVDIYFAGPIRAAGGTATVFPLILGDYARKLMNLDRYKPTEEEIERYVEESNIYEEIVTRQYKLTDEEIRKIIRGCPVCINGEPTEKREVSNHKNLERIESNRIRGGMCLVLSEGIGLKAMKILSLAKLLELDWSWLESIIKVTKSSSEGIAELTPNYKFLSKIAAGRPIISYPLRAGGFRLRYGKARNTSAMAKAIHPATMELLDGFLAVGTQIKIERPGKSAEIFPCDSIESPIVLLKSGEVKKINSSKEAREIKNELKEILFLGDILITYGDFAKSAHPLMPAGYCTEWWKIELKNALKEKKLEGINEKKIIENPDDLNGFEAVEISMQTGIPLHPEFIHYFDVIEKKDLIKLIEEARKSEKKFEEGKIVQTEFNYSEELKKIIELAGIPHKINEKKIIVGKTYSYSLLKSLGAFSTKEINSNLSNCEILTEISGITIKPKGGTFIGSRMGRPEAARPRKMIGNPHVLYPIGLNGGSIRSINKALEAELSSKKKISIERALFRCNKCKKIIYSPYCETCNEKTERIKKCSKGHFVESNIESCPVCGSKVYSSSLVETSIEKEMNKAIEKLRIKLPDPVKGVKGLINEDKLGEPLEKGILRAAHDVHIFRDGTIRYEALNAGITQFRPNEINLSVEKAIELGYTEDIHGKKLENENQMLNIFPQDLIIYEGAGDFLVKVTKFADDELERFYDLKKYFNINLREELIGELVLGLAPHTSAAIVGRIIGFTKSRLCFAHPYYHLAKRRNIDGDQDSLTLLMDAMLNFSQHYLPSSRGGRMDAPLVFTSMLNPTEIDDEAYEIETCTEYPLELYELSQKMVKPKIESIPQAKLFLGTGKQFNCIQFTHDTALFDEGPKQSTYVLLQSMEEKINAQAELQQKIRAIDKKDALERVLVSHFIPDIIGNARSFSRQTFRCGKCNEIFRRIPLNGKCTKCGNEKLILTIAEGSVKKYLEIAKNVIDKYKLSDYLKQRLDLVKEEIDSVFEADTKKQKSLAEFM
ncbi:MAG: DNA polymerase II large subunit [Candidatus Diapherotrites archaeon]|nr:DNA polymerase II large subunit [Candidatus Diapherotrites archaeon]